MRALAFLMVVFAASGCTIAQSGHDEAAGTPVPKDPPAAAQYDYNLLAFGDVELDRSATQGRLAARGDVTLSDFSVGSVLAEDAARCDLTAGGDLKFTDGSLQKGVLCVDGDVETTRVGTKFPGKTAVGDFAALAQAAADDARGFRALPPVTTTDERTMNGARGRIVLEGKDPKLNVFQVSAAAMALASGVAVRVPAGATAVIDVPGTTVSLTHMSLTAEGGAQAAKILLNAAEATALKLDGVDVQGAVLAPAAKLDFSNGTVTGSVIVGGAVGDGRYNWEPYSGVLP
jgi:choice-of-anchor A domain-containing protein